MTKKNTISNTKEKRKVGRPRTTLDKLPADWKTLMRECAQEGGSEVEARCILGISETAWLTLMADSEEFRGTVKECKALCRTWWERQGRKMAAGVAEGNATVWIFNMKNRFGWRDKIDVDQSSTDGTMTPKAEMTDEQMRAKLEKFGIEVKP